jgi:hypothetical protein
MKVIVTYAIQDVYIADLDPNESDPADWAVDDILNSRVSDVRSSDVQLQIRRADNGQRIV